MEPRFENFSFIPINLVESIGDFRFQTVLDINGLMSNQSFPTKNNGEDVSPSNVYGSNSSLTV